MTLDTAVLVANVAAEADSALLARAWDGDDGALVALLERYRPFVRVKTRPYFLAGADRDDVMQEGMIGLYKAIRDYDPTQPQSFRGFADLCITRQVLTAVKTATRQKHLPLNSYVSLHAPVQHDDDSERELLDQFVAPGLDPVDSVVSSQELEELQRCLNDILSDLEAEVLQRYVAGETYEEIAAGLDRHVKSIDNALQRIKHKLDAYLQQRCRQDAC